MIVHVVKCQRIPIFNSSISDFPPIHSIGGMPINMKRTIHDAVPSYDITVSFSQKKPRVSSLSTRKDAKTQAAGNKGNPNLLEITPQAIKNQASSQSAELPETETAPKTVANTQNVIDIQCNIYDNLDAVHDNDGMDPAGRADEPPTSYMALCFSAIEAIQAYPHLLDEPEKRITQTITEICYAALHLLAQLYRPDGETKWITRDELKKAYAESMVKFGPNSIEAATEEQSPRICARYIAYSHSRRAQGLSSNDTWCDEHCK